ncbi:MAG TPA: response regulator [Methanospirillum sp.]|nr:response regulator [Methanospirillum sp.]
MNQKIKILIVEDERVIAEDLREMLNGIGYEVMGITKTGQSAIAFTADHDLNLILMDINLAGEMDGITTAEQIKTHMDIPIIFLTAFATETIVARAKLIKPSGYILKPYSEAQIRTSIEIALYNHALERQLKERDATIRMLVNSSKDALMVINSSGKVQYVNNAMSIRAGKIPDDIIGMLIEDLKPAGIISTLVYDQIEAVKEGNSIMIEEQNGDNWYEYSLIPAFNPDAKITQIGYYCHDITYHKLIELGLQSTVNNLIQEQKILEQTREEIHQINEEHVSLIKARSAELYSVHKIMAKNQLIMSLMSGGNLALKEGMEEREFLKKICDSLITAENYHQSWIISFDSSGNPAHLEFSNTCDSDPSMFVEKDSSLKFCPTLGMKNVSFFRAGGEICTGCPLKENHDHSCVITAPILNDGQLLGVAGVLLKSDVPLTKGDEESTFIDICNSIGFTIQYRRSFDREQEAFHQISKNIAMISILNDEIRNPLTIIMAQTEMDGGTYESSIKEQVKKIDKVIDKLDGGFLESIKVFDYLKKHHGFTI